MSAAGGALALLLASMPLAYGVTLPRHERWRARWRLRSHAALDYDAGENDLVRATGIVRPLDETLTAPLSGRPCVAYRTRVWAPGHRSGGIVTTGETSQVRPFLLDLGDEEVIVEGDRALFGLAPIRLVPRNAAREASFLARHALSRGNNRFSEIALEPGMRVEVGGTLVLVPRDEPMLDGELGFRDPPPPSQRIAGNREHPLIFVALDEAH